PPSGQGATCFQERANPYHSAYPPAPAPKREKIAARPPVPGSSGRRRRRRRRKEKEKEKELDARGPRLSTPAPGVGPGRRFIGPGKRNFAFPGSPPAQRTRAIFATIPGSRIAHGRFPRL